MEDLIHQVLSTTLGERIKQPDFGCGLPRCYSFSCARDWTGPSWLAGGSTVCTLGCVT
jgi:hypothetical protein